MSDSIKKNVEQLVKLFDVKTDKDNNPSEIKSRSKSISCEQVIYYGVPGCGKSYKVNEVVDKKLKEHSVTDKQYHTIRCVFHPEYCNADFVGQIYPCVLPDNKGVEYKFKPGPFSEIVRRAYLNPDEPFFLIIEEINRGNAAAIFGEMFQLLDRIKKGEPADKSTENKYDSGWSSYGVDNQDINADIRDIQKLKSEQTNEKNKHCVDAKGSGTDSNPKCYSCIDVRLNDGSALHFSTNTAIRLPPNLSIYATMNTCDQNVFTLDNAFQRRFKFEMIDNDLDDPAQYDIVIGEEDESHKGVRWGSFRDWINEKILRLNSERSKSEDKCLGGWFISSNVAADEKGKFLIDDKKKVLKYENISRKDFAEKVLKYLWFDVFKRGTVAEVFNKSSAENGDVMSFARLAKMFKDDVGFEAFKKIFKDIEKDKETLTKTYAESKVNP